MAENQELDSKERRGSSDLSNIITSPSSLIPPDSKIFELNSPGDKHLPTELSKLTTNLFQSEKNLIKLREALPLELQNDFIRQIQAISKKRVAFISSPEAKEVTSENLGKIAKIQEEYNECLKEMISEFLEASEQLEYQEHEPAMKLLRQKSLTKGMIVGNINELVEGMDRVIRIGENLIIQGYQKLFIDTGSVKSKLQALIDERKVLPTGAKAIENLMIKQQFCEKQLNCLCMLFGEANTLTEIINKLQEFEKRQIVFQKTSQITVDNVKKFFYRPDARKIERRRTYLSVTYANPDNTREGLDILHDQINSIVKNMNIVCDMEDAKVRIINKSDLGDRCDTEFQNIQSRIAEEKEIFSKIHEILNAGKDESDDLDNFEQFIEEFFVNEEKPQNQIEIVKFLVEKSLKESQSRLKLAELLQEEIEKYETEYLEKITEIDKIKIENSALRKENQALKSQINGKMIEKISEGKSSLKELFDYQEELKRSIQSNIENQISNQVIELLMVSSGCCDILLGINPNEEIKDRLIEYENDYTRAVCLNDLIEITMRHLTAIFKLVGKLGMISEGNIHNSIFKLKKARNFKEAKEALQGKPNEFPLSTIDKTLTDIIKSYLGSLDDNKGNIENVVKKQNVIGRLFKDFKN